MTSSPVSGLVHFKRKGARLSAPPDNEELLCDNSGAMRPVISTSAHQWSTRHAGNPEVKDSELQNRDAGGPCRTPERPGDRRGNTSDHLPQTVVHVIRGNDVVAWFQALQQGRRHRES